MIPNTPFSTKVAKILSEKAKSDLFSWNLDNWNPEKEAVSFSICKAGFFGCISIAQIVNQSPKTADDELFVVCLYDFKWDRPSTAGIKARDIADFITALGGNRKDRKWSADAQPRVKGERAPMDCNAPRSAN